MCLSTVHTGGVKCVQVHVIALCVCECVYTCRAATEGSKVQCVSYYVSVQYRMQLMVHGCSSQH